MSTNLPEQQPSEEIDLGQLFKLIGNAFERFFNFLGSIFNKLFLAFVWLVFFIKKHFIRLVIAGVIGVSFGMIKQKIQDPVYSSTIVIKQNYDTGELLYNTINHYNLLIGERDSTSLGQILNITPNQASNLKEIEISSVLSENQKLQLFDEYSKSLDSTLAQTISFKDFSENSNEYTHIFQKITLLSNDKGSFNKLFDQIVENISTNTFFKNEQKKDIEELTRREKVIYESLKESDSLQDIYQEVLEKSVEKVAGGATSITFEGSDNKNLTKEYELYIGDLGLRRELVEINRKKQNIENIIEVISNNEDKGTLNNNSKFFGIETSATISIGLKLVLASFIILLGLEFLRHLERYKDKV